MCRKVVLDESECGAYRVDMDWGSNFRSVGQLASPLALSNERALLTYVHCHDLGSLRAVLSDDFGNTLDMGCELVLYSSQAGQEPCVGVQPNFS